MAPRIDNNYVPAPEGHELLLPLIKRIINCPIHADIFIESSIGTRFSAHLIILNLWVPFFDDAMSSDADPPATNPNYNINRANFLITFPNHDDAVVNFFLEFCYTGTIVFAPDNNQVPSLVNKLYILAHALRIRQLKRFCWSAAEKYVYDRVHELADDDHSEYNAAWWTGLVPELKAAWLATDKSDTHAGFRTSWLKAVCWALEGGCNPAPLEALFDTCDGLAWAVFRMENWRLVHRNAGCGHL